MDVIGSLHTDGARRQPIPSSTSMAPPDDENDSCRICRGEGTTAQPLFYPCKCSGSIKYVHQECLMEWLSHSQKKYCELCKTAFRFTKLYDQAMPATLPLPLFLKHLTAHGFRTLGRWVRYLMVGFVWLCWLPWSIRQVWRGLFWVADGGWISESDVRRVLTAQIEGTGIQNATEPTAPLQMAVNTTLRTSIFSAIPHGLVAAFEFIGYSTDDLLIVRLFKLIFLKAFRWPANITGPRNSTGPLHPERWQRQPSLLSNNRYFNSVTGYVMLDNIFLDIFEGQMICIFIVIAFVLVFLIREWVINQQPVLNMPDNNRADEQVVNVPLPARVAQPPRRRRRFGPRGGDLPGNGVDAGAARLLLRPRADAQRPRPPQPQRAATEGGPATGPAAAELLRQAHRTRSASLMDSPQSTSSSLMSQEPAALDGGVKRSQSPVTRPPLTPRGALEHAVSIHRSIEEGVVSTDEPLNTSNKALVTSHVDPSSTRQAGDRQLGQSVSPSHHMGNARSTELSQDLDASQALDLIPARPPSSLERLPELHPAEALHHHSEALREGNDMNVLLDERNPNLETDSEAFVDGATFNDGGELYTPSPTDSETSQLMLLRDTAAAEIPLEVYRPVTDNTVPFNPSLLESVYRWMWQIDSETPTRPPSPVLDENVVVEHIEDSQPFAPVPPLVRPNAIVDGIAEQPPAPVVQLHARAEDLPNDAEAIEDAEDLDGILELIGIQGPIVAMVQNVIFSEFLITLTIAASVWLPYIWGKIALLVLANPIAVFVRAPIYLAASAVDISADICLFTIGLFGSTLEWVLSAFKLAFSTTASETQDSYDLTVVPRVWTSLANNSGSRLEHTLSKLVTGLKPDYLTFSMQSHYALCAFKRWIKEITTTSGSYVGVAWLHSSWSNFCQTAMPKPADLISILHYLFSPSVTRKVVVKIWANIVTVSVRPLPPVDNLESMDFSLIQWNTQDKILAVVLGYAFLAALGSIYLKVARMVQGPNSGAKLEGVVADTLRQAGGVMKVIVIIGIEMIVFPLYCGLLLDFALLPLFKNATIHSRLAFMLQAPVTGLFVHWFIGTCYMFHFALFVAMCRRILRKGVLYFIRDPDDPTFHPVRDVLERPVFTQLGKIAFSALIYGGLVIMCLGGVVWCVGYTDMVLPIHWTSVHPRLAFPFDVIFYNFMVPFIIQKAEPSRLISAMYEWWFRGCATGLRLTHFLFGEDKLEEKQSPTQLSWRWLRADHHDAHIGHAGDSTHIDRHQDGTYVRVPAIDSVRIPKGSRVFLEVNENNQRIDGEEDPNEGMHGKNDERFTKVYLPPQYKARIVTLIILLWVFAAVTGVVFTVGPLLIGRAVIKIMAGDKTPPNDLYALTVGIHLASGIAYSIGHFKSLKDWINDKTSREFGSVRHLLSHINTTVKYLLGLTYLGVTLTVILPFALSLLTELFVHVPVYCLLTFEHSIRSSKVAEKAVEGRQPLPPTIFVLQTWTIGLLYAQFVLRLLLRYPTSDTRLATAIRAINRDGWLRPDVGLATRALIVPATVFASGLILLPMALARIILVAFDVDSPDLRATVYRMSYPGLLALAMMIYMTTLLKNQLAVWRLKIRDEIYLIGERLHNFQETKKSQPGMGKTVGKQAASTRMQLGTT